MSFDVLLLPQDLESTPIERASTLPSSLYTLPESESAEREYMFKKEWQLIGHVDQLREPGSFLTSMVGGNPLIFVKDESLENEWQVRGFYNVCKHRGGPLCVKHGTRSVIQCAYHGWTYKMDGSLRGVPQFAYVDLFDKADFGLKPVCTEVWEGLIFATLSEHPKPLAEVVGGIADRISPISIREMKFHQRVSYTIACNWKVYVDNYLEGYHIPIVHPELAKLLDYSQYVTELGTWYSLQYSPFSSDSADNPYQAEDGKAFYYFVYPNFMLNLLPGRMQLNIVEPKGVSECVVHFDYYYTDLKKASASGLIKSDLAYSEEIQQEDIEVCEAVQMGLASDAYERGRYSVQREAGVWHFHDRIRQSFRAPSSG